MNESGKWNHAYRYISILFIGDIEKAIYRRIEGSTKALVCVYKTWRDVYWPRVINAKNFTVANS